MKNLPLGIQTFSKLIEGDFVYIDKTEHIHKLFADGGQYYFLSRPRRFGKSLLISTLKEIFSGNRELFKGLWIYDKIDWQRYPVIEIDFSKIDYQTPEVLQKELEIRIAEIAADCGLELTREKSYKSKFVELIKKLSKENRVVILIDEYDKPIIDLVDKEEIARQNREILRDFYSTIKASDEHIKFAFMTGVTKFSRVSVFSGLNNLNDITLDERFSTMLGCTKEELLHYFSDRLELLSRKRNAEKKEVIEEIRNWYDGYSWDGKQMIFNPVSILSLFDKNSFANYWFASGTPTFLVKLMKDKNYDFTGFDWLEVSGYIFDSFDLDHLEITSLLFQTGYLTVKEKTEDEERQVYYLGYPNQEVKESLLTYLFREYAEKDFVWSEKVLGRLSSSIRKHDVAGFFELLQSIFASIPYNVLEKDREGYYHTVIYLILKLIGIRIGCEVQTNVGRIDAVVETDDTIYILEFKMGIPEEALNQIKTMRYHEKYLSSGKAVSIIGVGFDKEKGNISDYKLEKVT